MDVELLILHISMAVIFAAVNIGCIVYYGKNRTSYYVLENMDGTYYAGASTKRAARRLASELANEGICYKLKIGKPNYKKFAFMW